jgi:large subunit ribosomal protein L16
MLTPKKVKYRKWQTGRTDMTKVTPDTRGITVAFGSFGLKAISGGRIRSNQIESARKAGHRAIGKTGRMWIRIFPDRPFTAKPAEVGMGKGKGDPQGYCLDIRPGRILFEVDGVPANIAKEALRKAGTKLPVGTRVVER